MKRTPLAGRLVMAGIALVLLLVVASAVVAGPDRAPIRRAPVQPESSLAAASVSHAAMASPSVAPAPGFHVSAAASPTLATQYGTINLTAVASGGVPPYVYAWNLGDQAYGRQSDTNALQDPSHQYASPGNYSPTVVVRDSSGHTTWASATVEIYQGFAGGQVMASASPRSGSAPLTVSFLGNASGFTTTPSCSWVYGDGQSGGGLTPSHTFALTGVYTVEVGCGNIWGEYATYDLTIVVGAYTVAATAESTPSPASGQAPYTVNLTANATGWLPPFQYLWSFGDGTHANNASQNASHRYTKAGSYSAAVTVTDLVGGKDVVAVAVQIAAPPDLAGPATANRTSGDVPLAVTFGTTATGGIPPYLFLWKLGDGATSLGRNPSHTYQTAGTFSVTLTITDSVGLQVSSSLTIAAKTPASSPLPPGSSSPPGSPTSTFAGSLAASPYVWAAVVVAAAAAVLGIARWRRRRPAPTDVNAESQGSEPGTLLEEPNLETPPPEA